MKYDIIRSIAGVIGIALAELPFFIVLHIVW